MVRARSARLRTLPWRPILGLVLALVGLFWLPGLTADAIRAATPDAGPGATSTAAEPFVPTARLPRTARTTITVQAERTGARVTYEQVIELAPGDLLYDAVRGDLLTPNDVVAAVVGDVEIRFGQSTRTPDYGSFRLERTPGSAARITTTYVEHVDELFSRTREAELILTPPPETRAMAASRTVTARGIGYALDAVLAGDPDAERVAETTFVDPGGPVEVRLQRTAATAVKDAAQRRYGNFLSPHIPSLFWNVYEVSVLGVLIPWAVFFAVRRAFTLRGLLAWTLVGLLAYAGPTGWRSGMAAAVALPVLTAGWLGANRSWTRRGVRRYLIAVAAVAAIAVAALIPILAATSWAILVGGCLLGALVTGAALGLLGWRDRARDRARNRAWYWAGVGAVAGAAGAVAYVPATDRWYVWFCVLLGLLWAPMLVPVWPHRVPRWVPWAVLTTVGLIVFLTPKLDGYGMRWTLSGAEFSYEFEWPTLARLALIGCTLHMLWKRVGPSRMPVSPGSAGAVRRRYRAFARAAAGQRDPLVRAAGVALVVAALSEQSRAVENATIAYLIAPLTVLAALRPRRDASAERLARLTGRAFARLLDASARIGLAHRILDRLYTSAPAHLASGDLSLDDFQRLHTQAVQDTRRGDARTRRLPVLASGAGRWATRNGTAGALIATVLALPLVGFGIVDLAREGASLDVLSYLEIGRRVLRWTAYGFFFGCFYPSLRGRTPVAKALVFSAALAAPEFLLAMFTSTVVDPLGVIGAATLRAAQVLAVMLLLGLVWEYRLARIGRVPWSYVRDVRQFSALAAPLTALAVTVASTVIAVLVPEILSTADVPPVP